MTPTDKFVEAMHGVIGKYPGAGLRMVPMEAVRQAVEAFADAECDARDEESLSPCHWKDGGHTNCRAALLKKVME